MSTVLHGEAPGIFRVAPEVAAALTGGGPVVALESTIITHGMPYPDNLATARAVEDVVREHGATPATIALVRGGLRVGLEADELEHLAEGAARAGDGGDGEGDRDGDGAGDRDGGGAGVAKASRRDLPALMAAGRSAGTTVAATMYLAHLAGIEVFATGGIGGVHRGADTTWDVSADLDQLAVTRVAVVCAGAKSILDLPKTLEVLETRGVPVLGFGTDEFPAFFTRTSGLPVDHRVDTPEELAEVLRTHRALGLSGGIVVANPVPAEDALDPDEIGARIDEAVAEAERAGVHRKELTPYLLGRINELTGGRSLAANVALVRNNAALAARTAVALGATAAPGHGV
jgi:pseudouridine-5'-phosphate glycosidase